MACNQCPAGLLTEATGASTFDKCNVIPAGFALEYVFDKVNGLTQEFRLTLQPCPHGTFGLQRKIELTAPDWQAWGCQACPYAYTTKQEGATSDEPCKAPPGYYVAFREDSTDEASSFGTPYKGYRLEKCPSGFFRAGWAKTHTSGSSHVDACSACGEDLGTQDTVPDEHPSAQPNSLVSTSPENCYVPEGWGAVLDMSAGGARLKAYKCSPGTYGQATKTFGLSPVSCAACTRGLFTDGFASIGEDACKHGPGVGYSNGAFTRCPVGSYNPATSMEACAECPNGRTTLDDPNFQADPTDCFPQPGWGVSKAEADYSIAINANDDAKAAALAALAVAECMEGTYSKVDAPGGASEKLTRLMQYCSDCPAGSTTWDAASASVEDCNVCLPGHQKTGDGCAPCPVGFFQSERDEDATCMQCPDSTLSFANKETFTAPGLTPAEGAVTEALCYPAVFPIESPGDSFGSGPPLPPLLPLSEGLWAPFTTSSPAADFATCRATCPTNSCCLLSHAYGDMGNGETGGTCTRASFERLWQATNEGIPLVSLHLKVPAAGTVSAAAAAAAAAPKTKAQAAAALAAARQPFELLNVGLAPGNSSQILVKIKDAADGTVQMLTAEEFAKKHPSPQADESMVKAQSEFNGVYARCTIKASPTDSDSLRQLGETDMFKLYAGLGLVAGGMPFVDLGNPDHHAQYLTARSKCDVFCNQNPQCIGYIHLAVFGETTDQNNDAVSVNACNLISNFLFTGSPVLDVNERGAVVVP